MEVPLIGLGSAEIGQKFPLVRRQTFLFLKHLGHRGRLMYLSTGSHSEVEDNDKDA